MRGKSILHFQHFLFLFLARSKMYAEYGMILVIEASTTDNMQISSQLFLVLFTVVDTVSIFGEPCLPGGNGQHPGDKLGYGKYDMPACDACADNGENKGQCCDAIYRNSSGRDADDLFHWGAQPGSTYGCYDIGDADL